MNMMPTKFTAKKYESIQMMRGVAALSVVFMHIDMFHNGAFGVDLFFVISGFIMMHVTEIDAKHFLQKRAIRIVPLYWSAILLMSIIVIAVPSIFRTQEFKFEFFIKSMLFIPYFFTGQSGRTVSALHEVGWTLICEVFFYVLFFVSMKINHKYRHIISSSFLLILVIVGLLVHSENVFIRFYCRPIMLEFALGMLAYKFLVQSAIKDNDVHKIVNKRHIVLLCVFASLIWIGLFFVKHIPLLLGVDRFIKYGVPSFVFFLIIFKAMENNNVPRFFVTLGNISYSLYITHPFITQGFSRLVFNMDNYSLTGTLLAVFIVIPMTICVAWISWFIIEKSFSDWLRLKLKASERSHLP